MIAEGKVFPDKVEYNNLPWKFTAGTPNILGTILSAEALRLLIDFSLNPGEYKYFRTGKDLEVLDVEKAMDNIREHERMLIGEAQKILSENSEIKNYGVKDVKDRTCLIAFTSEQKSVFDIANELNKFGVESRAGCHCATLAHHFYKLNPPASCRLSFYIYNNLEDVKKACLAVRECVCKEPKKHFFSTIAKIFAKK
jgi:cysteine desulfurase / selenocysteine lyase